ncbi:MAG: hypothetical protein M3376_01270 [Actinomycetota bacterium]|nr:hypothetical protein [Actinomycetota bacterium]
MLACDELPGVPAEKVARLHAMAQAALDGRLDADRLRTLDPGAALAELQQLKGIGPFYAQLIHIRSTGVADVLVDEPRVLASAAHFYRLPAPPGRAAFLEFAEPWAAVSHLGDRAAARRRRAGGSQPPVADAHGTG